MDLPFQTILTILTSLGLGSFITLLAKSYLDNRSKRFENEFDHKEKRYKAIMIQMWACIDPDTELSHLQKFRPDITTKEMLFREIELEIYNGILYASDPVIKALKDFNSKKDYQSYLKVALAMRIDLYGKKSNLKFSDIDLKSVKE